MSQEKKVAGRLKYQGILHGLTNQGNSFQSEDFFIENIGERIKVTPLIDGVIWRLYNINGKKAVAGVHMMIIRKGEAIFVNASQQHTFKVGGEVVLIVAAQKKED